MKQFIKKHSFLMNLLAILGIALFTGHAHAGAGWVALPFLFGMSVPAAPGMPDYTATGPSANIPWIFSKKTVVKFYDQSVIPQISNTDYEGEIKAAGDKVIINTVPDVLIRWYVKGGTTVWQQAQSAKTELDIDKAADFAFVMDKIDIKQFAVKMMDKLSADAAEQMKIFIDTYELSVLYTSASAVNQGTTAGRKSSRYNLGVTGSPIVLSKTNIVDYIMMCEAVADEQNWPYTGRWMVLPTWATFYLNTSELKDASLTGEAQSNLIRGGRRGKLGNFTLYASNLYTGISDGGNTNYPIMFGHMSGITFAAQLTEMEFFEKLETTFGSGMKGLQVWGCDVIKSEALGVLYAR
jgi:hypothetical protein